MKKNILITGAAGFIGFHLAKRLHSRGDYVIGYDNFNDYYDPLLKRNRTNLLKKEGVEIVEGDICNFEKLQQLVKEHKITHIVNLAAQAGVRKSVTHPQAYIKDNLEGFVNILEICRIHPEIKLIYASSSSVYGLNEKVPFAETDDSDRPASLYGASKKANELIAHSYNHLHGISVTGLRFFTVYGPWGRPDMAYYLFTKAIIERTPVEIYNYGKMKRDFTYIDDIIQGLVASIDLGAYCEIFNLGTHQSIELLRFVEILEQEIGIEAIKTYLPMQSGDVIETYADIEHSKEKLNFIPQISIEEGLSRFVAWYKEYYSI